MLQYPLPVVRVPVAQVVAVVDQVWCRSPVGKIFRNGDWLLRALFDGIRDELRRQDQELVLLLLLLPLTRQRKDDRWRPETVVGGTGLLDLVGGRSGLRQVFVHCRTKQT